MTPKTARYPRSTNAALTEDQYEWLVKQALKEDRPTSGIIRRLITEERERIAASQGEEKP